jgi:hypothetical protein
VHVAVSGVVVVAVVSVVVVCARVCVCARVMWPTEKKTRHREERDIYRGTESRRTAEERERKIERESRRRGRASGRTAALKSKRYRGREGERE